MKETDIPTGTPTDIKAANAFESGVQKVIPSVLVYLRRKGKVLMIQRHDGIWNGLGGKCELNESPLEACVREVREESGLEISADLLKPLGVIQFPNFKPHKREDWIVFIFSAELFGEEGEPDSINQEGSLHWVPLDQVRTRPLWEGDRTFIDTILKEKAVVGTIWYESSKVVRHWIRSL